MRDSSVLFLYALVFLAPHVSSGTGIVISLAYFGLAIVAWFCGKGETK